MSSADGPSFYTEKCTFHPITDWLEGACTNWTDAVNTSQLSYISLYSGNSSKAVWDTAGQKSFNSCPFNCSGRWWLLFLTWPSSVYPNTNLDPILCPFRLDQWVAAGVKTNTLRQQSLYMPSELVKKKPHNHRLHATIAHQLWCNEKAPISSCLISYNHSNSVQSIELAWCCCKLSMQNHFLPYIFNMIFELSGISAGD